MVTYLGQDGNTYARFANGSLYIVRGNHYVKVS